MKFGVSRNVQALSVSLILSSSLIAGGIAYAAGETITACVKKSNGDTRIISGKMKCTKSERTVAWGSAGEQGPAGATGATGSTGPRGVSSIYVKDGNGNELQNVIAFGGDSTTLFINNQIWAVSNVTGDWLPSGTFQPFYIDSACTGPVKYIKWLYQPTPSQIDSLKYITFGTNSLSTDFFKIASATKHTSTTYYIMDDKTNTCEDASTLGFEGFDGYYDIQVVNEPARVTAPLTIAQR